MNLGGDRQWQQAGRAIDVPFQGQGEKEKLEFQRL
jgi:hypothetical protein